MGVLDGKKPEKVFQFFEEIAGVVKMVFKGWEQAFLYL